MNSSRLFLLLPLSVVVLLLMQRFSRAEDELRIDQMAMTNELLSLRVMGTASNAPYGLLSRSAMEAGNWVMDAPFLGDTNTNHTMITAEMGESGRRFYVVGSAGDSDGDGLPDVYELKVTGTDPNAADTGNTGTADGYKDPDGDGKTHLQEMNEKGDPLAFGSPEVPFDFTATQASGGGAVTLRWAASAGSVSNYVIQRKASDAPDSEWVTIATVTNLTELSFEDTGAGAVINPVYRMWTTYLNGQTTQPTPLALVNVSTSLPGFGATIVRGPLGSYKLMVSAPPPGLEGVVIKPTSHSTIPGVSYEGPAIIPFVGFYGSHGAGATIWAGGLIEPTPETNSIYVSVAQLTNGLVDIPLSLAPWYSRFGFEVRPEFAGGRSGNPVRISPPVAAFYDPILPELGYPPAREYSGVRAPFMDAREQMQQNLRFMVRGSFSQSPAYHRRLSGSDHKWISDFFTLHDISGILFGQALNEFGPIQENFMYRNSCVTASDFPPGDNRPLQNHGYSIYDHALNGQTYAPAAQLGPSESEWLYHGLYWDNAPPGVSVTYNFSTGTWPGTFTNTPFSNLLGLEFTGYRAAVFSIVIEAGWGQTFPYYPPTGSWPHTSFASVEEPVFETVDYLFLPFENSMPGTSGFKFPGQSNFNDTNTTPPLLTAVGQTYTLAAWARKEIVNATPPRLAYLGQYFEAAYRVEEGQISTNQTGILSEYGEFTPTEPGIAALVTMPEFGTGTRGTAIVHVVKIQLDVNHDGVMNPSYIGPDNTSETSPFVFWHNNDYDRGHVVDGNDYEEDDLITETFDDAHYPSVFAHLYPGRLTIPSLRDLEDYARLHFPGLSALCETLPQGWKVQLKWASPINAPKLNLYRAVESDGGDQYLFNETVAADQFQDDAVATRFRAQLTPMTTLTLWDDAIRVLGPAPGDHFIFCGAARGRGELVLQILDENAFVTAQASAWIEIKDIKELYERYSIGESGAVEPLLLPIPANEAPRGVNPRFRYPRDVSPGTPYILHVHGWNMETWEKDRFAETMFKRLYWQGYQGHFGAFRWPTRNGFEKYLAWQNIFFAPNHFDRSEFTAWKSGPPLRSLLRGLAGRYGGSLFLTAHSMGNVVAGEALRVATNAPFVTGYIAMQGAIPAHAYDATNPPPRIVPFQYEDNTPNRHAEYYTNGAPEYFHASQGAQLFVNFYNPVDFALDAWETDQNFKPANSLLYGYSPALDFYWKNDGADEMFFPQDTWELFSFVIEARSRALGAEPAVGGVFTRPIAVNLNAAGMAFGDAHKGHSAQFRSTNMKRNDFWREVIQTFDLTP